MTEFFNPKLADGLITFNKIPEDKFVSDLWSVYQYIIDGKVITVFGEDHNAEIKDLIKLCKMYKPDDIVLEREDVMPSYNMATLYKYKKDLHLNKGIKDFRLVLLGENLLNKLYDNSKYTFLYYYYNVDKFKKDYVFPLIKYISKLINPFPKDSELWNYYNKYVNSKLDILDNGINGNFKQEHIWYLQQVYSEFMDLQIFTHLMTGSFKRSFVLIGHYHSLNLRNMLHKFLYISRVLVDSGEPLTQSGKINLKDTLIPNPFYSKKQKLGFSSRKSRHKRSTKGKSKH